jgi:hypothetical protein
LLPSEESARLKKQSAEVKVTEGAKQNKKKFYKFCPHGNKLPVHIYTTTITISKKGRRKVKKELKINCSECPRPSRKIEVAHKGKIQEILDFDIDLTVDV